METTLLVDGMSCQHCVRAVVNAVGELEGVHSVDVNLDEKTVKVMHESTTSIDEIKAVIEDEGYAVVG